MGRCFVTLCGGLWASVAGSLGSVQVAGCLELDLGAGWPSLPPSRLLLSTAQVSVAQAWLQWALLPRSVGFHAWDTGFPASPGSQLCLLPLSPCLAQCLVSVWLASEAGRDYPCTQAVVGVPQLRPGCMQITVCLCVGGGLVFSAPMESGYCRSAPGYGRWVSVGSCLVGRGGRKQMSGSRAVGSPLLSSVLSDDKLELQFPTGLGGPWKGGLVTFQ